MIFFYLHWNGCSVRNPIYPQPIRYSFLATNTFKHVVFHVSTIGFHVARNIHLGAHLIFISLVYSSSFFFVRNILSSCSICARQRARSKRLRYLKHWGIEAFRISHFSRLSHRRAGSNPAKLNLKADIRNKSTARILQTENGYTYQLETHHSVAKTITFEINKISLLQGPQMSALDTKTLILRFIAF